MREEEKFLEKFILARGRTMTLPRATPGKREFHSVFRLTRVASFQTNPAIPGKTFPFEERRDGNGFSPQS